MVRYLRLYAYFVRFSFSRALEFRTDFFFRVVMDAVFYAVHIAFWSVLYEHTDILGGWTRDKIYIFAASYFMIDALHMTIFSNNAWWLPIFINKGDLDYYLVRPVSPLFFLSFRDFAANSFLNLLLAAGLLIFMIARYPDPLGAMNIALYLVLLFCGFLIHYMVYMMFIIPAFWTHTDQGLRDLFFNIERLAEYPHRVYTGWARRIIVSVAPFALMTSYPCMLLFEGGSVSLFLHTAAVLAGTFGAMVFLWRLGLRSYASASS
ncbi:MAG: ABC-2 family transporter protein [Planctomycetota bacterium]